MCEVYHYTTLEKLLGILRCQKDDATGEIINLADNYNLMFHASDVRMINSSLEYDTIFSAFQRKVCDVTHSPINLGGAYSISFCKRKDYIPMWNMCVRDPEDVGICLGLSRVELEDIVKNVNSGSFLELKYDHCKYMTALELENEISDYVKTFDGIDSTNIYKMNELARQMMVKSAFYRLRDFEFEQETRLVGFIDGGSYTNGERRNAPYKQIEIPAKSLRGIIIGPYTKNADIIKMGIEAILQMKGYFAQRYSINVELSKLELR